jgi:uncharacterized membrane protein YfcA
MLSISSIAVVLVFIYAGISDWKRREVDDIVSIAAWAVCWIGGFDLNILIGSFLGIWLLAEIASHLKKPIFGWADILTVPPFMAAVSGLYGYVFSAIILCGCLVAAQMWLSKKKSKKRAAPLVFFLALGLLIATIIRFLF